MKYNKKTGRSEREIVDQDTLLKENPTELVEYLLGAVQRAKKKKADLGL